MLSPKQRATLALKGQETDRPLFCPAIYEHKAKLLAKSPSEVSRDPGLLEQAVLAEYETYGPDMLTVGIDVYNVEPEALGCKVRFPEAVDAVPVISSPVLNSIDDICTLAPVDPESSARMPLILMAAQALNKKLGSQIYIRGAISGPCSIAAKLLGIEKLLIAMIDQPDKVDMLLGFCAKVGTGFGRAFIRRGLEVAVFDSYATPPLISPTLFHNLVLPHAKKLIADLRQAGAQFLAYVIGGRTDPIAEHLFAVGADIILSDFPSDVDIFLQSAKDTNVLIRRNISPILIENGPDEDLRTQANAVATLCASHQNVIAGTGVISYNTSIDRVLMAKNMCLQVL